MRLHPVRFATGLVALLLACTGSGGTGADTADADTADVPADVADAADDADDADAPADAPTDAPPGCAGNPPLCAQGCGSDYLNASVCVDGQWQCPAGFVLPSSCPPGTCWGGPTPGEVCGPDGWECHPEQHPTAYEQCPDLMCPECTGFDGPVVVDGCRCACEGGQVLCTREGPPDVADVADAADAADDADVADAADAADVPLPVVDLVLDPATLQFFGLPIDSIRWAVSGHDKAARTCVTLVWDFSNHGMREDAHCDDFFPGFPYVVLVPDTDGPCGQWDYGTQVASDGATGCVDFAVLGGVHQDLVDVRVPYRTATAQGTIRASNRAATVPPRVSLGLRYGSDIPEAVFVQSGDAYGLPAWVRVRPAAGGDDLLLFDRCDLPVCGTRKPACGAWNLAALNITGTGFMGQVFVTWDGMRRTPDPVASCWQREPAAPGDYVATFCFGWQTATTPAGVEVQTPDCKEVSFTLPASKVEFVANYGG